MTENVSLQAEKRDARGKMRAKRLRKEGLVPGVYYDKEGANIPLTLGYGELHAAYTRAQNQVIYLEIKGGDQPQKNKPVLIWDIQFHPVKGLIEHVDLIGVDLAQEVRIEVPVEIVGTSQGVEKGGMLDVYRDTVPVSCLPTSIPEKIEVDVSEVDIGDSLHLSEVTLPEGVTMQDTTEDLGIVGVVLPRGASAEEEEEEGSEEEPTEE